MPIGTCDYIVLHLFTGSLYKALVYYIAVLVIVPMWATADNLKQNEAAPQVPQQSEILNNIISALRSREQVIEKSAVAGVAIDKRYLSESEWLSLDINPSFKTQRANGTYSDRDMAIVRFNLSEHQWMYEVQQLLWSGWSRWFAQDYSKKPTDVADLYRRASCDGERIYWLSYQRRTQGYIEQLHSNASAAGLDQRSFRKWLGVGLGRFDRAFSQMLRLDVNKERVSELKQVNEGGKGCYLFTYGHNDTTYVSETKVWIADINGKGGFIITKWDTLSISKTNPKLATRYVTEWSDWHRIDDVLLPNRIVDQEFDYAADVKPDEIWRNWNEVTFNDWSVISRYIPKVSDYAIPIGTVLSGFNGIPILHSREIDKDKAVEDYEKSMAPWVAAEKFRSEKKPILDEEYTKPLTGNELQNLTRKYGF